MKVSSKSCGIYLITCVPNGRRYVGQSVNIQARWNGHRCSMRNKSGKNILMENCWHKYGEEAFEFKILELCEQTQLTERETHWIEKLKTMVDDGGFNLREPTDNPNSPQAVNSTTRKRMSESKSFKYEAFGESLSLTEWSEKTGLNRDAIRARITRGYSIEDALTKPREPQSRQLEVFGCQGNIKQLCERLEKDYGLVKQRLGKNWCPTKAFLLPVQR